MDGKVFMIDCKIAWNRIIVTLKFLVNTRANGYLFINKSLAIDIVNQFRIKVRLLDTPIGVIRYDEKTQSQATHVMGLHFKISGW